MKAGIHAKRILLMVAPLALILCAAVVVPAALERWEDRRERLDAIQAERVALYRARLEPCPGQVDSTGIKELALWPGEVGVDVFPAFAAPEGFRLSHASLSGHAGVSAAGYLPPPPPPPGRAEVNQAIKPLAPTYKTFPPVVLPQALGTHALETLKAEIDHADAAGSMGLDGITYILRYDDKCAFAWSPAPGTRAYKIVGLVNALDSLSKEDARKATALHADVSRWIAELESDTRELAD